MVSLLWLFFIFAVLASLLTWGLRYYALSRSLIDIPNARSSHSVPTPRGGGVAIVVSFLAAAVLLAEMGRISWETEMAILGSGASIAILGFLDDHGHIAARWRLLGHFCAAFWALFWLGHAPVVHIGDMSLDLGWFAYILASLYLVWMLNLYNFMDGIDGIASVEAVSTCSSICLIYWLQGYEALSGPVFLLGAATLGFLLWNFPPARIFMGDAGSGFLGIILGLLSLQAAWVAPELLWAWLILLGVFIVDATVTLFRRLVRGEKIYEAHRSHAYQFAVRHYGRHLPITLAVLLINVFWLLPIALFSLSAGVNGFFALLLAYAPLVILSFKFNAGQAEKAN
ncbi:glycosyltransferase family 4 protein [Pseudomonas asplenii]|uniref:MraY family glycosyltransferase n=1 Tax=Pseudomonas asplenii TaxID=53407 RepID=UPI00049736FE